MRASLADDQALDRPATAQARSTRPPVSRQALGVLPRFAVGPNVVAEARSPVGDPLAKDLPDGPMQPPHLSRAQRVSRAQGAQPREPERLVRVDVPDPGDERLVDQEGLEPSRSTGKPVRQAAGAERRAERLRAVARKDVAHPVRRGGFPNLRCPPARAGPPTTASHTPHAQAPAFEQADPPELAHVAVTELPAV